MKKTTNSTIKTKWDLTLLYKNMKELDKHIEEIDRAFTKFAKKYQSRTDWLEDESKLKAALDDHEKLWDVVSIKPYFFLKLSRDLDQTNKKLEAKLNQLQHRMAEISNKLIFFSLALGKVTPQNQKKFLKSKKLGFYHYYLKQIFEEAKHDLTEAEEKILNTTSITRSSLWVSGVSKNVARRTIRFDEREWAIPEAMFKFFDLPTKKRRALWKLILEKLDEVSDFAESEINAAYTNKKISDNLRGYKKPYSARLLANEDEEKVVLNLVNTVTKSFKISHKFYKLKKKIGKFDELLYADNRSKIGEIKRKYPFKETVSLLRESFEDVDPIFRQIFDTMLKQGRIDVFPKKGKTGGAYQWANVNTPSYILLNHVDTFDSVSTIAHEMGHAFHSELSKSQEPLYQGYSTSVAETASTLFENFVFDKVFETLSKKEQILALHNNIQESIYTIFRYIAVFNFEVELNETIRRQGYVSKEEIGNLLMKHMKSYCGPAMKFNKEDGLSFINWSHLRYDFYSYAYPYGELISNALYERYKEDNSYIEEIKKFLSAGGSKPPHQIFKEIGIDTKDPNFWKEGLKKIERDIKELERLTK